MLHLMFALLLMSVGAIDFLPTIIAALRQGRSVVGIFLLNLFLGWTVIGWVIALIWALTNEPKWVYGYPPPSAYRRY